MQRPPVGPVSPRDCAVPRVLSLDAHGRILNWMHWQDAVCLYVRGAVAWTLGEPCLTVHGGTNRASGQSLTRILALPWILFAVFMMFLAMSAFRGGGNFMEGGGFIFIWLFIGLGVDFFFGIRAKVKLEEEFRAQAMARYAPAPSLWQRLFGNSRTP